MANEINPLNKKILFARKREKVAIKKLDKC